LVKYIFEVKNNVYCFFLFSGTTNAKKFLFVPMQPGYPLP